MIDLIINWKFFLLSFSNLSSLKSWQCSLWLYSILTLYACRHLYSDMVSLCILHTVLCKSWIYISPSFHTKNIHFTCSSFHEVGTHPKCAIFGTCLLISHQKTFEWNYWLMFCCFDLGWGYIWWRKKYAHCSVTKYIQAYVTVSIAIF